MLESIELIAADIAQVQSPDGAFRSRVHFAHATLNDRNCFVTALALRELSALERAGELPHALIAVRRRALGFLLRAVHPLRRHAFAFYPPRRQPFWLDANLPADADDTSVAALELVRAGVWDAAVVDEILAHHLLPFRATPAHVSAPFHRPGAFLTWFSMPQAHNDIDLVVNVNVLAFLAGCGRRDAPGYADGAALVDAGVRWLTTRPDDYALLAPYYASSAELLLALRHAVDAGACELGAALRGMEALNDAGRLTWAGPLFCNRSRGITWTSTALGRVRALRERIERGNPCPG